MSAMGSIPITHSTGFPKPAHVGREADRKEPIPRAIRTTSVSRRHIQIIASRAASWRRSGVLVSQKAAKARWGEKPPRATHKGNFREEFGIDVECYVLNDEAKTGVISQRGMAAALGLKDSSGLALPKFLAGVKIAPYVGSELGEKLQNPLIFQQAAVGGNQPLATGYGYDKTVAMLAEGYNHGYTPWVKTAISIPDAIFEEAERLAKIRGWSRSELYANAVSAYVNSEKFLGVREKLDAVYGQNIDESIVDPVLARAQARSLPKEKW
jgi:hypothetical protein